MKYTVLLLLLIAQLLGGSTLFASATRTNLRNDLEIKLQIQAAHREYTFEDYLSCLKVSSRNDRACPLEPAQREMLKEQHDDKPLNPVVLFRW